LKLGSNRVLVAGNAQIADLCYSLRILWHTCLCGRIKSSAFERSVDKGNSGTQLMGVVEGVLNNKV